MLHSGVSAVEKRAGLRRRLASGELTTMPGAFSPTVARMIERHGFGGVYVSGHMLAASLGLPDIGLTTSVEVAAAAQAITRNTDLPVIVDADTGFGSPLTTARTIQLFEDAGLAGCHIEDQADPKKVGGSAGVQLVDPAVAARRIEVAVAARRDPGFLVIARTDAAPVEGMASALDRARKYHAAGADMIFVEGLRSGEEIAGVVAAGIAPLLVNINETGGNRLTVTELRTLGVAIAIYPMALTRLALAAAETGLSQLATAGSMAALVGEMYAPQALAELLDAEGYEHLV